MEIVWWRSIPFRNIRSLYSKRSMNCTMDSRWHRLCSSLSGKATKLLSSEHFGSTFSGWVCFPGFFFRFWFWPRQNETIHRRAGTHELSAILVSVRFEKRKLLYKRRPDSFEFDFRDFFAQFVQSTRCLFNFRNCVWGGKKATAVCTYWNIVINFRLPHSFRFICADSDERDARPYDGEYFPISIWSGQYAWRGRSRIVNAMLKSAEHSIHFKNRVVIDRSSAILVAWPIGAGR